jgi:hypothetical protein
MEEKTLNKRYWLIIDFPNRPGHEKMIVFTCQGVTKEIVVSKLAVRQALASALHFLWKDNQIASGFGPGGSSFGLFEIKE